jgi:hypothetical protein
MQYERRWGCGVLLGGSVRLKRLKRPKSGFLPKTRKGTGCLQNDRAGAAAYFLKKMR